MQTAAADESISIAAITEDYFEQIKALEQRLFDDEPREPPYEGYCVITGGRVVIGYVYFDSWREDEWVLYVSTLGVDSAWQRRGIGSVLMTRLTAFHGNRPMLVRVEAGNEVASKLYRKFGFVPEIRPDYQSPGFPENGVTTMYREPDSMELDIRMAARAHARVSEANEPHPVGFARMFTVSLAVEHAEEWKRESTPSQVERLLSNLAANQMDVRAYPCSANDWVLLWNLSKNGQACLYAMRTERWRRRMFEDGSPAELTAEQRVAALTDTGVRNVPRTLSHSAVWQMAAQSQYGVAKAGNIRNGSWEQLKLYTDFYSNLLGGARGCVIYRSNAPLVLPVKREPRSMVACAVCIRCDGISWIRANRLDEFVVFTGRNGSLRLERIRLWRTHFTAYPSEKRRDLEQNWNRLELSPAITEITHARFLFFEDMRAVTPEQSV